VPIPTGLTFSSAGVLSGTPLMPIDEELTIIVTDATGLAARYRTQREAKIATTKKRMDTLFMKRWGLTEDDYSLLRL
jgi:hypothetical protein